MSALAALGQPLCVMVVVEAEHMCMSLRGVQKPGALTVTTHFTGAFRDDASEQVRFMTMLRGGHAENALPQNMYYRYDYYRDNCSTRVRDALAEHVLRHPDWPDAGTVGRDQQSQVLDLIGLQLR